MKYVPVTQGRFAVVDDEDFDKISSMGSWHLGEGGCAATSINGKTILMHRVVMGVEDSRLEVDHKKHDRLDNRKSELRICSHSDNVKNKSKYKNGTASKYKGVGLTPGGRSYRSRIRVNKKLIYLGTFSEEKEAALAYNDAAQKFFGEFAYLNEVSR